MGWVRTTLGEIYDVRDGTHDSPKYQESGYPLVTSKNLKDGKINLEKIRFISEVDFSKINERSAVHIGDVLFAMIGTIGNPTVIVDTPNFAIKNVALFKVGEKNSSWFLKYYLESPFVTDKLAKEAKGTTQKFVGLKYLRDFPIALPPAPEQKRIAAILDQAFADIAKARALTEQNLKNARELFESTLQQVFSQRGEGWEQTTIGQITGGVFTGPFGSLLHKRDYIENGVPLVNPAHITALGIEVDNHKSVSAETKERLSSYVMKAGDIVIGRRGEMGRCALITEKEDGYLCGTGSFFIKTSDRVDGNYLVRYLRSDFCRARLEKIAGGAVMPNLSNSDLSGFSLCIPSIERQQECSKLIDDISISTEKVMTVYRSKIQALEELKKSLLQQAFSGELSKDLTEAA